MRNKFTILVVLAVLLTSCISSKVVPVSERDASSINGKKIAVIYGNKPNFGAITPGNMIISVLTGGIAGYFVMTHEGNEIIRKNKVDDPAILISGNLARYLKDKYDAEVIYKNEPITNDSLDYVYDVYGDSVDYVLKVKTTDWAINYLRFNTDRYRTIYSSRIELVDVKSKKIIAESPCSKNQSAREVNNPPTYDSLLNENAKFLKEDLTAGAKACSDLFEKLILK